MTQDNFEESQDPPLLSEDIEWLRTLEFAAGCVVDLSKNIDEKDLSETAVSINAERLYDIVELLLTYAEVYEDFPSDEMVDMAEIEKTLGRYRFYSGEEH